MRGEAAAAGDVQRQRVLDRAVELSDHPDVNAEVAECNSLVQCGKLDPPQSAVQVHRKKARRLKTPGRLQKVGSTRRGHESYGPVDWDNMSSVAGTAQEPAAAETSTAVIVEPSQMHANRELRVGYRADIDGLRAVAVLSVIVFHMKHSWLPGGFVGVDVFFVISGFVVSHALLAAPAKDAKTVLVTFYARRAKRLAPALVLMVLAVSAAHSMVVPPSAPKLRDHFTSGQLALIGFANQHYALSFDSYWDAGINSLEFNPFTHTWSLGVEEQVR